jgi:hypothetical protein
MREKFGEKVRFRNFGGRRMLFGAPFSSDANAGSFAAVAAAAASFGRGGDSAWGGGAGLGGMEQRLVESVFQSVEERLAFKKFQP